MAKKKQLTKTKAKTMLKEGKAHGKKLTERQKGLFGIIAGGGTPRKKKGKRKTRRK